MLSLGNVVCFGWLYMCFGGEERVGGWGMGGEVGGGGRGRVCFGCLREGDGRGACVLGVCERETESEREVLDG